MPDAAQRLRLLPFMVGGAALCLGIGGGLFVLKSCSVAPPPLLPPMTSSVTVVRPTPDVLVAVRDLARLESASFHMERVIDLSDKQSKLWGMINTEDAILLVAVAEVTAGIDLQKLTAPSTQRAARPASNCPRPRCCTPRSTTTKRTSIRAKRAPWPSDAKTSRAERAKKPSAR